MRDHLEKQERAFIAASHRTDRSLDKRMESAHKASEIHSSRTGKRLVITREAVESEEMYPEEDLPPPQSDEYNQWKEMVNRMIEQEEKEVSGK